MESNTSVQEKGQYVRDNLVQIKRFLNSKTDEIIKSIDKLMVDIENERCDKEKEMAVKTDNIFLSDGGPGRGQFMSLLQNSSKANSVKEMILYIEYQKAKDRAWKGWTTVAPVLTKSLTSTIEKIYDGLCFEIMSRNNNLDIEDVRLINLMIMRKYMGYLYWKVTILKGEKNQSSYKKKGGNC